MATLFVATAGGHLAQLVEIADRLPSDVVDAAVWVTHDNAQSRSLMEDRNVEFVPEVGRKDVRGVLRSLPHVRRLHREWNFSTALSTGSGLALGYLPYLAARRVRVHYIESASRMSRPSLTGRLLSRWPGVRMYTQYPWNAHRPWHYAGSVFEGFDVTEDVEPSPIRRAVVALGTMPDFQFRRMLDAVAPLLRPDGELEHAQGGVPVETLWQTGATRTEGLGIEPRCWVPATELDDAIAKADLVVGHAGAGTALSALSGGRLPVLIPRDDARGEVGDAHQRRFAQELEKNGLSVYCEPEALRVEDLISAARCRVRRGTRPRFELQS